MSLKQDGVNLKWDGVSPKWNEVSLGWAGLNQDGLGRAQGARQGCSHLPGGRVPPEVGEHPREPVIDFIQR